MEKSKFYSDHSKIDRSLFEIGCFNYIIHIGVSELLIAKEEMTEDFQHMIHHSVCNSLKIVRDAGFTEDEFEIEVDRQLSTTSDDKLKMYIYEMYREY